MGVSIDDDNKLVIITASKTFYFDLPENIDNNFNHKILS